MVEYGKMHTNITWYADTQNNPITGKIERRVNGGAWATVYEQVVSAGASGDFAPEGATIYNYPNTIEIRVSAKDNVNNWSGTTTASYTLLASPAYLGPTATNSWRPTNSGEWNARDTKRLYQGYATEPTWNGIGCWFYGTQFVDVFANKTIVSATMLINRETGGNSSSETIELRLHKLTSDPGDITHVSAPEVSSGSYWSGSNGGGKYIWGTLRTPAYPGQNYSDNALPIEWMQWLQNNTNGYRGIAVKVDSGQPYVVLSSIGENIYSGLITVTHLG
jgi:hypothetical protein